MARIPTGDTEKIINIKNWHGVNEAPEGEARLELGEAAVMRNFRVTSGGALKKRPGSRDVAGFLDGYTALVRPGSARALIAEKGVGTGHLLYPRAEADEAGNIRPAGTPVSVDGTGAAEYRGYFLPLDGRCWALDRVERLGRPAGEPILGGSAAAGALEQFAQGRRTDTLSGQTVLGTQTADTWPEAYTSPQGELEVRGEKTVREAPTGREPGWETRNMGGYFLRDGRLWKYYGTRIRAVVTSRPWNKYRCQVDGTSGAVYKQGPWVRVDSRNVKATAGIGGYGSYEFFPGTGEYSLTGGTKTLWGGESGTLYCGCGVSPRRSDRISKYVFSRRADGSSTATLYNAVADGPYDDGVTRYLRGGGLGQILVPEGTLPEEDRGYAYAGSFEEDGVSYTVMRGEGALYCYALEKGAPAYDDVTYGFYGYPMETWVDEYRWYFNETYCRTERSEDMAVRGIWSGFVAGREVLCAACGGMLWELREENGLWSRVPAGAMDTSRDVHMFGFDGKLYLLNGQEYAVWDGERLEAVEGYRPLVAVDMSPEGEGTPLEGINRLSRGRRCRFSPDGTARTFHLPERDIAAVDWAGAPESSYAVDTAEGTVTFDEAPPRGINTLEIAWSAREDRSGSVRGMRFAELFNGAKDSRVFLYGDGSNRAVYSGIDHTGLPRADYFPELCEVTVGDANTPLTALIRHYNKLMAFKTDSAWSIGAGGVTLEDGSAGFSVTPVNRSLGNCAWGQARLVQNRPRTLDGRSVIEWSSSGSGGVTGDQRNAQQVSQRVDSSIRRFDLSRARTFYDKFSHEYYVIGEDGTAIVQNLDRDAWYVYTGMDATSMINYRDELYFGTRNGYLRHFSDEYCSDNGAAIDAEWQSGAMSMGEDFRRKTSAVVWIGIKPEDNGYLEVTAQTDRERDLAVCDLGTGDAGAVPETARVKLRAKRFTYYKLILRNNTADRTVTVVSADLRIRGAGLVR